MDTASYLLKNSYGIYHFRMVVPKRFRPALQLREVKRSLHTKKPKDAQRLARRYASILDLLFEQKVVTQADLSNCLKNLANPSLENFRQHTGSKIGTGQKNALVSQTPPLIAIGHQSDLPLLSEVMDRFVKHQTISNAWNERTRA